MNRPLTVYADRAATTAGAVREVVASLPESLALGGPDAQVRAICGTPGWVRGAVSAIESGARGILVVQPGVEDITGLQSLAWERSVAVVVDHLWASNPAVELAAAGAAAGTAEIVLVDVSAEVDDARLLKSALLESFALVQRLAGVQKGVRLLASDATGFTAASALAECGAPVTVNGTVSRGSRNDVTVRLLTIAGSIELTLPHPATACPAVHTVVGPEGSLTSPTMYESAHRASWRRMIELQRTGSTSQDLVELGDVQALLA